MHPFISLVISSAIPKLVHTIHDKIFGKSPIAKNSYKTQLKIKRKSSDTRPISRQQYDYINEARSAWKTFNIDKHGKDRKTRQDLVNAINSALNLDKSESYYGDIWSNRKKRESFIDTNL